jgi:hypothetical protein
MARKTKYTPETVKAITDILGIGGTIKDACASAGISHETYHSWVNEKAEFSDNVTRAQANARQLATFAIRSAIKGAEQTAETVENLTETRLRKAANGEQVPYEYKKSTRSQTVTKFPMDWRAGVEYLKRRDPEHWSERLQVDIDIKLVVQLVEELNGAGIDATEFFTQALERAKTRSVVKRTSGE